MGCDKICGIPNIPFSTKMENVLNNNDVVKTETQRFLESQLEYGKY